MSIAVTPNPVGVPKGLTQQLIATGTFSDASTEDLTHTVIWTAGTPAIASVDATSGLATAVAVGSTEITAMSGAVSGSSTLNVTAAILESLLISPDPAFSGIGLNTQLTVTGTYSDASTANVTGMATWTSDMPSVATVGPATGLATGVSLGSTTINAAVGSLTPASALLSITVNAWHPAADMLSSPRCNYTDTLLLNGKVLATGGANCDSGAVTRYGAVLYDPVSNSWSLAGSLTTSRGGHTATLLLNGKVLVTGGTNRLDAVFASTILMTTELYDPTADTWSSSDDMLVARVGHAATLLPDGRVLVAGGDTGTGVTATAELYDPSTNMWSPAASMASARSGHTMTLLLSGKVLVAGGAGPPTGATAELYDPSTNTWSAAGSMSTPRTGFTATLLAGSGNVVVAGGFTDDGAAPFTASVEIYDSVANTWSPAASLPTPLTDHAATLLPTGEVLVSGGFVPGGNGNTASAELYDPVTNTWSAAGSMAKARAGHLSTLLQDGVVLVTGGDSGSSCELYW